MSKSMEQEEEPLTKADLLTRRKYMDNHSFLKELVFLFNLPLSENCFERQYELFCKYFEQGQEAFCVSDLPQIINLLEVVPLHINEHDEWHNIYDLMLQFATVPPVLNKSSDLLNYHRDIEEYMSTLAELILHLESKRWQHYVIDAILTLLVGTTEYPMFCLSVDTIMKASVNSRMPQILGMSLILVDDDIYKRVLEMAIILCKYCRSTCHTILKQDALHMLCIRLEPTWSKRSLHIPPEDPTQDSDVMFYQDSSTLIWLLLNSINVHEDQELIKLLTPPTEFCLRNLRYALQRFGQQVTKKNHRNNILAILLKLFYIFPTGEYYESGFLEDIAILLVAGEGTTSGTFWEFIKMEPIKEDWIFKRLLLSFLPLYHNMYFSIECLQHHKFLECYLPLLKKEQKIQWPKDMHTKLMVFTISVLTDVVPQLLPIFIDNSGFLLFLDVIKRNREDREIVQIVSRALIKIMKLCQHDEQLMSYLVEQNTAEIFLEYAGNLLNAPLCLKSRNCAGYFYHILEKLSVYRDLSCRATMHSCIAYLRRCLHPHNEDDIRDPRTMLNVCHCLWITILHNNDNLREFLQANGVYLLLDVIEILPLPIKLVALGLCVDLCMDGSAIPFFITWRGKTSRKLISFLLEIFREENEILKVKVSKDGIILDNEAVLMGEQQRLEVAKVNVDIEGSAAISDMYGSCRPKVYAILQLLTHMHQEKTHGLFQVYKMYDNELDVQNRITMQLADNFFALKLSEVWMELYKVTEKTGMRPLILDFEVLAALVLRTQQWGLHIQKSQQEILDNETLKDKDIEKSYYHDLKESRLAESLLAFKELDYITRCTEPLFRTKKKIDTNQILHKQGNIEENIPYHKTFISKINLNPVFNQAIDIQSNQIFKMHNSMEDIKVHLVSDSEDELFYMDAISQDLLSDSIAECLK